jgi:hypothetical protein
MLRIPQRAADRANHVDPIQPGFMRRRSLRTFLRVRLEFHRASFCRRVAKTGGVVACVEVNRSIMHS